ncbi:MAG: recombinase family protein [Bacteroidota bacterium]
MKLGYARVSTYEQNLDLQLDALKKEGCKHLFSDKVSGVKAKKPNFDKLLSYAREGDTIVVWKLDRLGRSTVQLIELAESLQLRGVHLKSLSESIDTTSAMGKMFFQPRGDRSCAFWQSMNVTSFGSEPKRDSLQPGHEEELGVDQKV